VLRVRKVHKEADQMEHQVNLVLKASKGQMERKDLQGLKGLQVVKELQEQEQWV
jgi:hypothetical protein